MIIVDLEAPVVTEGKASSLPLHQIICAVGVCSCVKVTEFRCYLCFKELIPVVGLDARLQFPILHHRGLFYSHMTFL